MAELGRAASAEELKLWPFRKLTGEIKKQVRRDVGGGDMHTKYKARLAQFGNQLPSVLLDPIAELLAQVADEACKGSRDRIGSKVDELVRRVEMVVEVLNP